MKTNLEDPSPPAAPPPPPRRASPAMALAIAVVTGIVVALGALLYARARSRINDVALASTPKLVTVVVARSDTFRPHRRYVATIEPWMQAAVGPQFIAAYADAVGVRPGDVVKRGQVLATLDCRNASASQRAVSMQARAIEAKQKALASEAARVNSLLDGGYVAANEAEQKIAGSASELAELLSTQARLSGTSLAVDDCVLRAPFDGEVSARMVDPGAFVRPGTPIVSLVDRSTVRVTAEVPEGDFAYVAAGTPVTMRLLATGQDTAGIIARRSPAASLGTRTVHFEIDLADPARRLPVGTTAEITVEVGAPQPATLVPAVAATVRGDQAVVYVVEGDRAKKTTLAVKGEEPGALYLDPSLAPGSRVVTEGRSLLADGDRVQATLDPSSAAPASPAPSGSVARVHAP